MPLMAEFLVSFEDSRRQALNIVPVFPLAAEEASVRRVDEDLTLSGLGNPYLGSIHRDHEHSGSQSTV